MHAFWLLFSVLKYAMQLTRSNYFGVLSVDGYNVCPMALNNNWGKVKGKVKLSSFFNLGTRRGWVVNTTPRPLYPRDRDPVLIVQEAGWAPGPVATGAENLAPTAIRSPDRPARSESLYRLRYPGPPITEARTEIVWIFVFSLMSLLMSAM